MGTLDFNGSRELLIRNDMKMTPCVVRVGFLDSAILNG